MATMLFLTTGISRKIRTKLCDWAERPVIACYFCLAASSLSPCLTRRPDMQTQTRCHFSRMLDPFDQIAPGAGGHRRAVCPRERRGSCWGGRPPSRAGRPRRGEGSVRPRPHRLHPTERAMGESSHLPQHLQFFIVVVREISL